MKKLFGLCAAATAAVFAASCAYGAEEPKAAEKKEPAKTEEAPSPFKSQKEKVSYAIGMSIGKSLKEAEVEVDAPTLAKALNEALTGAKSMMTQEEADRTMMAMQQEMMDKQMKKMQETAEKNKKEGEAFLEENKKKEGVKVTGSGLQYKVVKEGQGKSPAETDTVTVHYVGTLIGGKEFDSSMKRGEPATFQVNQVIKGWAEALPLMKVGSEWELIIPSNLAYGERGAGSDIGPNSVLVFKVQLLDVKEAPKTDEKPAGAVAPEGKDAGKPEVKVEPKK
jgi:FKBP-type peptidyl-prolyl cis-trans isomerase FklB